MINPNKKFGPLPEENTAKRAGVQGAAPFGRRRQKITATK